MPGTEGNQGQQGNGEQGQQGQGQGEGGTPETWEAVLEGLPEDARSLYESHTQGLRSALESERGQRRDLARQLREATEALEEGSDARTQLESLTQAAEAAEQRVAFYEEAAGQGVKNFKLAWLAAQESDAFDRRGNVQWERLQEEFPELFQAKQQSAPGNAGAGTNQAPGGGADMNAIIRRGAGRRV
jgi:hypothetical protein